MCRCKTKPEKCSVSDAYFLPRTGHDVSFFQNVKTFPALYQIEDLAQNMLSKFSVEVPEFQFHCDNAQCILP